MAFDIKTAQPIKQGFDITTARPVNVKKTPEIVKSISKGIQKAGEFTFPISPIEKIYGKEETVNPILKSLQLQENAQKYMQERPGAPYGFNLVAGPVLRTARDIGLTRPTTMAMYEGMVNPALAKVVTRIATTPAGRAFLEKEVPNLAKEVLKKTSGMKLEPIKLPQPRLIPKSMEKGIRKYITKRKPYEERAVQNLALTPEERLAKLTAKTKEKYVTPLKEEQELLGQTLEKISGKEKIVLAETKSVIEQNKLNLKQDLNKLSSKMEQETTLLKENIDIASQKSAQTGKRLYPRLARENSTTYGNKLDDIVNIAEQESKLPTKTILQDIFDKTDTELAEAFLDTGAPLIKYNAIKSKYLGGIAGETNPEAQAIMQALGIKKGQLKGAGIDWSKVDISQSQFKPPDPNAPINLKGLLKDIRSVSKAISAKAKGAERAFTDEDLVAVIFQKNIGEYMAKTYPKFAKLQKAYSPLIEQMKAGRKLFKPGAPYELGTAPKTLVKPDIVEKRLIGELEKGTKGFNKGLGEITQPIIKAQKKLAGTEKGYEIAKTKLTELGKSKEEELVKLLEIKKQAYELIKEKVSARSMLKQKALENALNTRLKMLAGRGEKVSLIMPRAKILGKERKVMAGGGIATLVDYLIRRIIARSLLR